MASNIERLGQVEKDKYVIGPIDSRQSMHTRCSTHIVYLCGVTELYNNKVTKLTLDTPSLYVWERPPK